MKISAIETFQLSSDLDIPFGWSQDWIEHRSVGIVKITTDEGLVGWGEDCTGSSGHLIDTELSQLLIGEVPTKRLIYGRRCFKRYITRI